MIIIAYLPVDCTLWYNHGKGGEECPKAGGSTDKRQKVISPEKRRPVAHNIVKITFISFLPFQRRNEKNEMNVLFHMLCATRKEETMPVSKAQQRAVSKYMKENYDVYQIRMPKGKKDDIKAVAAAAGESVNQYILNAVDQRISREAVGDHARPAEAGAVSLPSERAPAVSEGQTEGIADGD